MAEICVQCNSFGGFSKSMKRRKPKGHRICQKCVDSTGTVAGENSAKAEKDSDAGVDDEADDRMKLFFAPVTGKDGIKIVGEVVKSAADKRKYKLIELPNGLQALLIARPDSTSDNDQGEGMTAAAMAVRVGSFSDPDEIPGLAHFCEHMLFMGTEKYPDENEWEAFLAENGGDSNASTDCEYTIYQFEVASGYLSEALKRFSGFFTCPLFKPGTSRREARAVDSEYKDSLQSDHAKRSELLAATTVEGHPFRKFMWGNVETLETIPEAKGVDVREALLKFHARYYTANAMRLAVYGKDLDQMQSDVIEFFSQVLPYAKQQCRDIPQNARTVSCEYCHKLGRLQAAPIILKSYVFIVSILCRFLTMGFNPPLFRVRACLLTLLAWEAAFTTQSRSKTSSSCS